MSQGDIENLIVIRVDGGLCSQLAFVALGMYVQDRLPTARVKYDLSWYREADNQNIGRDWALNKAFPDIRIDEATDDEIHQVFAQNRIEGGEPDRYEPPLYVGGYPERETSILRRLDYFRSAFSPSLSDESRGWLDRMSQGPSCAVHVRRGDLSVYNTGYGYPTTVGYFEKAVRLVRGLNPEARFWFFSDEPDFVRSELLPMMPPDCQCEVVVANDSDRGHFDLYLISRCEYIISSSGSFGTYAYMLAPNRRALVMSRRRDFMSRYFENVIYLNDDRRALNDFPMLGAATGPQTGVRCRGLWRPLYKLWKTLGKILFAQAL